MGKPGDKNQSKISNIFKRVPNANYESTEAIIPGIGGMGEQSSEDVYMSDPDKSPLQQNESKVADADKYKEQFTEKKPKTFDAVPSTNTKAGVKFEFGKPDVRDGK